MHRSGRGAERALRAPPSQLHEGRLELPRMQLDVHEEGGMRTYTYKLRRLYSGGNNQVFAARVARLFQDRVRAYVTLQKNLERSLTGMNAATEVERLKVHQDALARGISGARQDSHRGDIFTPDVAALFR